MPSHPRQVFASHRHRLLGLPPNIRGALWILGSAVLFTGMSVMVKSLGDAFDPFEIAFFRSLTALVFMMPFMFHQAGTAFKTRRPFLHLVRGGLGSMGMMCGFYALVHLPLATANAISFSRAIFLVPLAMLVIGEVVGIKRVSAAVIGFIGVLIILRPSVDMDYAALVAAGGALAVAGAVICVKLLSRTDGPKTLLFYSSVIGLGFTAIPASFAWRTPDLFELISLGAMGAFGVLAQTCFIRAYSVGDVGSLAPFDYTRLLLAAIAGYFLFGNLPDVWTWIGALVIVGSTLYITLREVQVAKEQRQTPDTADAPLLPEILDSAAIASRRLKREVNSKKGS